MEIIESRFTILFDPPFWIGLYERTADGQYQVCRIVFGTEPRDQEVYDFLVSRWNKLCFTNALPEAERPSAHRNPKRVQREIHRQVLDRGAGTKAQQALARQREQDKRERRAKIRDRRRQEADEQFALRQEKKKEKRRGR